MLVVIEVERIEFTIFNDIQDGKEITLTGKGISLYPEDNYIKELEDKARKYDELMEVDE
jgi:hypothetical protein